MNFDFKVGQIVLFQIETEEGQEPMRVALVYQENKWAKRPLCIFTAENGVPQGDDVLATELWSWLDSQIQIPGIELVQCANPCAFELKAIKGEP